MLSRFEKCVAARRRLLGPQRGRRIDPHRAPRRCPASEYGYAYHQRDDGHICQRVEARGAKQQRRKRPARRESAGKPECDTKPCQAHALTEHQAENASGDLAHVERVTGEVARQTLQQVQGGVPAFEPFIRYHLIKHEFIKRLHKRFDEEGIVIPFRIRTIISRGDRPSAALPGNLS